jgi:DNA primase
MAFDRVKLVKEANDIVDVVGAYVPLRPAGQKFIGLCPFHDDRRPSFAVDPHWQNFRCWSCGKYGDVISFVQEHEHVSFMEALELLARRANITLDKNGASSRNEGRARLLDAVRWAAQQYHECLLDDPVAEDARRYLGERGLKGETVRRWGLGYAPLTGDWLVKKAAAGGVSLDDLETAALIARRQNGPGCYDRFRDRVQFPIRDPQGRTVGFGGRILPKSPLLPRAPKYYNSEGTPLFSKSETLYGIDQARHAAAKAGCLAVVEGYTDVLMAHQCGVSHVVATMGTALNARHIQKLRHFTPRVVLVFDADAGGDAGVDRALEIFAGNEIDLAVAALPQGLDPCDLLLAQGADAFRAVLGAAVDALEFKLSRVLAGGADLTVEGRRRAVDAVLGVVALAPPLPGQAGAVKTELMVNRIAHRLTLKEETVWARLEELRQQKRGRAAAAPARGGDFAERKAPARPEERQLLELLLADPAQVPTAAAAVRPEEVEHPGLRRLLDGLYALHAAGEPPTLDQLRPRLEHAALAEHALILQDVGRQTPDRGVYLQKLLGFFRERQTRPVKEELRNQLQQQSARDPAAALELLRQLTNRTGAAAGDAAAALP